MNEERKSEQRAACAGVREELSAYIEGELSTDVRERVEGHLGTCPECRLDLELLRRTVSALRTLPELPAPAGILVGVRDGLQPQPWYRRLRGLVPAAPKIGIPLGAAATLLVAFGIFLLSDRFPDLGRMPEAPPLPVETSRREPALASREKAAPESRMAHDDNLALPPEEVAPPLKGDAPSDAAVTPAAPAPSGEPPVSGRITFNDDSPVGDARIPSAQTSYSTVKNEVVGADADDYGEGKAEVSLGGTRTDQEEAPKTMVRKEVPEPSLEIAAKPEPAVEPPRQPAEREVRIREEAPPHRQALKKARRAAAPEAAVSDMEALPAGNYRKSLPLRGSEEMQRQLAEPGSRDLLREADKAGRVSGRGAFSRETEVLTIVSFGDDEVRQVRESLEKTGGTLLEMQTLDYGASQRVALTFQDRLDASQVISRGWQIRALVPLAQVEEFVASLEGQSSFQLLERTQAPAAPEGARPGTQSFEIRLLR